MICTNAFLHYAFVPLFVVYIILLISGTIIFAFEPLETMPSKAMNYGSGNSTSFGIWGSENAFYYSWNVLTTIGYGNLTCVSNFSVLPSHYTVSHFRLFYFAKYSRFFSESSIFASTHNYLFNDWSWIFRTYHEFSREFFNGKS
jgi:hypothetical protein